MSSLGAWLTVRAALVVRGCLWVVEHAAVQVSQCVAAACSPHPNGHPAPWSASRSPHPLTALFRHSSGCEIHRAGDSGDAGVGRRSRSGLHAPIGACRITVKTTLSREPPRGAREVRRSALESGHQGVHNALRCTPARAELRERGGEPFWQFGKEAKNAFRPRLLNSPRATPRRPPPHAHCLWEENDLLGVDGGSKLSAGRRGAD